MPGTEVDKVEFLVRSEIDRKHSPGCLGLGLIVVSHPLFHLVESIIVIALILAIPIAARIQLDRHEFRWTTFILRCRGPDPADCRGQSRE